MKRNEGNYCLLGAHFYSQALSYTLPQAVPAPLCIEQLLHVQPYSRLSGPLPHLIPSRAL